MEMLTAELAAYALVLARTGGQDFLGHRTQRHFHDAPGFLGANHQHEAVEAVLQLHQRENRRPRRGFEVHVQGRVKREHHELWMVSSARENCHALDFFRPLLAEYTQHLIPRLFKRRTLRLRQGVACRGRPHHKRRPQGGYGLAKVQIRADHWISRFRQGGKCADVAAKAAHCGCLMVDDAILSHGRSIYPP